MTREEEIKNEAALNYPFIAISAQEKLESEAFVKGAQWADEHPCMSEEEQVGMEGLGIVWQKKHLINKAIDILIDFSNDGCLIDIHNYEEFEKQFRKVMEE